LLCTNVKVATARHVLPPLRIVIEPTQSITELPSNTTVCPV
jgi:hypothetical protein